MSWIDDRVEFKKMRERTMVDTRMEINMEIKR